MNKQLLVFVLLAAVVAPVAHAGTTPAPRLRLDMKINGQDNPVTIDGTTVRYVTLNWRSNAGARECVASSIPSLPSWQGRRTPTASQIVAGFQPGYYVLAMTCTNTQGHQATDRVRVQVGQAVPPSITSVSPTVITPGATVTITGEGFLMGTTNIIRVGGSSVSFPSAQSANIIRFTFPANTRLPTGQFYLNVGNANGESNRVLITLVPRP